jgi:hypothetical protein
MLESLDVKVLPFISPYKSFSGLTCQEAQITFVSALTASAVGLAAIGSIDYVWNSFENAFKNGIFFNARRK